MIISDLYDKVLINPVNSYKANKLFIVSGYTSATFARRHLLDLEKVAEDFEINLIVGMPRSRYDHLAFVELHDRFKDKFHAYYYSNIPPVHCKAFSWFQDDKPIIGYTGSANYSQYGFLGHLQRNQMVEDDPLSIRDFYNHLISTSIYIPDLVVESAVKDLSETDVASMCPGKIHWAIADKRVRISFLATDGTLPVMSGLNWGQRLERRINRNTGEITWAKREPNQAYLSLKQDARKEGFLPDRAYTFTLITDDNHSFDCVVAQDGRKAIQSTNDNSELGRYIRNRIGVPLGSLITKDDLLKYGRTDYTIEKLNDETFLFDFSV